MATATKQHETERRFAASKIVAEKRAEGESMRLSGYAAVFDKWSEDLGGFREKIARGAFTKTLRTADVRFFFNHDSDYVLGRTASGTLRLSEDDTGLRFEVDLPDTQLGRDVLTQVERGDLDGMSFGFRTIRNDWSFDDSSADAIDERTLIEVELIDVSVVTFPAYPDASVAARSRQDERSKMKASRPRLLRARARLMGIAS